MARQWYGEERSLRKGLGWRGWGGNELNENTEWPGRTGEHRWDGQQVGSKHGVEGRGGV